MLRRQARLRREYLYRKSQETKDRVISERKRKLKDALDENKPIPTELRKDALSLQKALAYDDEGGEDLNHIDDEYRWAGVEDPKIMLTTSRDPSSKLKQFAKEVKLIFPNAQRLNRGNYDVNQLVQACRANEVTDLLIIHEHRGVPDALQVCHLPYGPTAFFTLLNTVMRHDIPNIGTMSEVYPHLIFHNFKSKLGERDTPGILLHLIAIVFQTVKVSSIFKQMVHTWNDSLERSRANKVLGQKAFTVAGPMIWNNVPPVTREFVLNILKYLFPVPKEESKRVITFANQDDVISFRHHMYKKTDQKNIDLSEVGPRFEMKLYEIRLGTIEKSDPGETEWVARPYMNTAKKRKHLSDK